MKTLYLTQSGNICIDDETNKPTPFYSKVESIRNIYLITEPTKIVYGDENGTEELYAEEDDIVIVFYRHDFKHHIVIAKSSGWVENIKDYDEQEQKRKEEWAKENSAKVIHSKPCADLCCGCDDTCPESK